MARNMDLQHLNFHQIPNVKKTHICKNSEQRDFNRMRSGNPTREKILHWLFEIGIWFKGIDGILELIGGILLLVSNPHAINNFIVNLTEHELQQDPGDWICNM